VGAAQQEEAGAGAEVEVLNKALQDVRGKVQQRRADSQAQTSQGAVVKALMAAKSCKEIPGILGRLGAEHSAHCMPLGLACSVQRCVQLLAMVSQAQTSQRGSCKGLHCMHMQVTWVLLMPSMT